MPRSTLSLLLCLVWIGLLTIAAPPAPAAEPAGNADGPAEFSDGFEAELGPDGLPPGWTGLFGVAEFGRNVVRTDERAFEGRYSIRIEDESAETSVGLRSAPIPARPGIVYEARVEVFVERGAGQLYLEFWNDAGERIHYVALGTSQTGSWSTVTIQETAPPGTTSITLLLYGHVRNTGVAFYDAVALTALRAPSAAAGTDGSAPFTGVIAGVPPIEFDLSQATFVTPPLEELRARIPSGRPRLFARPETLDDLRAKRNRSLMTRLVWQNIQTQALIAAASNLPPEPPDARPGGTLDVTAWRAGITIATDILRNLHALGFAYLISGEERYAEAGKALLLHVSRWDPYGTSGRAKNDEVSMRLLYGMSRAYDWLHPALSPEERRIVQESMRARGNDVYLTMRRSRFEETLRDNHLTRSMGFLGEAAIAFMGELPEAEVWFDYIVSLFILKYPPWGGDEGGWSQGVSYWQSYISWVLEFLDAFRIATGVDLYEKPFFQNTGWFKFYAHPPKSRFGAFGDHSDSPPDEGSARVMSHFAGIYGNPAFQWYAHSINGMGRIPALPLDNFIGYVRMPETPADMVDPVFPADFVQSRLFSDVGWVIMNVDMEDWENNVHVKFKSSPYGSFNHSHAEQNSFIIEAYGSPLAISSGYYPWYGSPHHATWTWESRSKNTILVNGRGQGVQSFDAKGKIVRTSFGDAFDYVLGDATQAYEGRVDRFLRHLWFVKPDLIVVYDQLEAEGPATYDWLLHTQQQMEVDEAAGRVRVPAATAEMWVSFVHPGALSFHLTDQFTVPPEDRDAGKPNQWHLTATTTSEDGRGRFLTVMAPRPASAFGSPAPEVTELAVENGHGALVQADGREFTLAFRDDPATPVRGGGFAADADAVAWWREGDAEGLMALAARDVAWDGTVYLRAEGGAVDAAATWRCEGGSAELELQLSGGTWSGIEIRTPCAPQRVLINGEEAAQESWSYRDGIVSVRPLP